MQTCEYCKADIPEKASFCGACGQAPSYTTDMPTRAIGLSMVHSTNPDITTGPTQALSDDIAEDEEEEEKKRQHAALIGLALPMMGDALIPGQPFASNAPLVQGTPQFGGAPTVQGTPQFGTGSPPSTPGSNVGSSGGSNPGLGSPWTPPPPQVMPPYVPPSTPPLPQPPVAYPPNPGNTPGCLTWMIVVILPLVILATIFGTGLIVFSPTLSLSGNTNVTFGGILQIHGSNFIANDSVTLTLDDSIQLYAATQSTPLPTSHSTISATGFFLLTTQGQKVPTSGNSFMVNGDGTFNAKIPVSQNWHRGKHTIRASEGLSPRSASLTFNVSQPGQTATPSPTGTTDTLTPTDVPVPSPSVIPSPTTVPTGLSNLNPNTITLGPVGEGSNQPVSTQVTLNTIGSGPVMWTATWDQNKAPWLQLGSTSGQIQAPDTQTITVSALASRLKAGTYTTLVTFGNTPSNQAIMLNITLTVQAGCITATPKALNFTGIANTSDPAPQTVTLNNCGLTGTWSGSATTGTGGNWLSVQPTSGSIDGGKTQTVNITASNLSTRLSAGAYRGNLLFVDGSSEINIPVTFIVQSLPILTVNLTSIDANRDCSLVTASEWSCTEILTNNPGTQTSLNWTASSGGNKSIVFRQSSGTIAPGQTVSVVFLVSTAACQAPITLIFTGPANTVNVPLTCTPLIA